MSEAAAGRPVLRILAAGAGVTLQDRGRHGALRYGITPAGPMDPLACATANRALGNPPGATAIEVGLGGLALTVEGGRSTSRSPAAPSGSIATAGPCRRPAR